MDVESFANKKIVAGLCGIFLGGLGVHKFILGLTKPAVIMLAISLIGMMTFFLIIPIFAIMAMNLIGFIEGIIYLTKSKEEFYKCYAVEKKEWF